MRYRRASWYAEPVASMSSPICCANCNEPMSAEYCGVCGQRRFRPEDRRFAQLAKQLFEALTDLDGRFWRSLRALMLQPGRLSRDWFDGRRAAWMSPVSLFLLANLLYFLAPAISDFDLPMRDQVSTAILREFDPAAAALPAPRHASAQMHAPLSDPWVRARLRAMQAEIDAAPGAGDAQESAFARLERDYDLASSNYSKLLIILHVPFLALGLMLLAGSGRYFAEHFVVALHFFAFVLFVAFALFFVELLLSPGAWLAARLDVGGMPAVLGATSAALLMGYAAIAVRRSYDAPWWRSVLAGIALPLLLLAINVSVYRALQFAIVMALA